jgi:hypothetical protein
MFLLIFLSQQAVSQSGNVLQRHGWEAFSFLRKRKMDDNDRIRTYDHCILIPVYPPRGNIFPPLSQLYKEHKMTSYNKDRHRWLSR